MPGASGTHSVCVCYHQNPKLRVHALNIGEMYKDLLSKTVCSVENKECMLVQCDYCCDISCFEKLQDHCFIAHSQSQHLNQLIQDLDPSWIIIIDDFAENYAFIVQDEIQSYHPITIFTPISDIL